MIGPNKDSFGKSKAFIKGKAENPFPDDTAVHANWVLVWVIFIGFVAFGIAFYFVGQRRKEAKVLVNGKWQKISKNKTLEDYLGSSK